MDNNSDQDQAEPKQKSETLPNSKKSSKPKQEVKKKKAKKTNPQQGHYISSDSLNTIFKSKFKRQLKKRSSILISAAIKALTVNLLKDAALNATAAGSKSVTCDHLKNFDANEDV